MTDHTYALAERLRGIASDSLYTFEPGSEKPRQHCRTLS